MRRLLSQTAAAKYCGLGEHTFRRIIREGNGPKMFNPHGGRPLYAVSALDEWMHSRDDRKVA